MSKFKKITTIAALLGLTGCGSSYLSVRQEWVDSRYLASTYVNTPDPRQEHPPIGQKLVVDWLIPKSVLEKHPELVIQVIRWDFTEEIVRFPINRTIGYEVYSLLNERYEETEGLLTYRAQIVTEDHEVYKEWTHQLWVNLIEIEEQTPTPKRRDLNPPEMPDDPDKFDEELYARMPAQEDTDKISSSVEDQSKQGSVIETPYLSDGSSESD